MVDNAGAYLRSVVAELPVREDQILEAAEKYNLPIGLDVAKCPVARTIFIAGFAGDATGPLEVGKVAVWRKFQQLACLEHRKRRGNRPH